MSCWSSFLQDKPKAANYLDEFREQDVRCGMGSSGFKNVGNILFRKLINLNKDVYQSTPDTEVKKQMVLSIIVAIQRQSPPGRFLEKNVASGRWYVVSTRRAISKTSQALRERVRPPKSQRWPTSGKSVDFESPSSNAVNAAWTVEEVRQQLRPQQEPSSCRSLIADLDIATIFDVDASQLGKFSDCEIEEWIVDAFLSDNDCRGMLGAGIEPTLEPSSFSTSHNNDANYLFAKDTPTQVVGEWMSPAVAAMPYGQDVDSQNSTVANPSAAEFDLRLSCLALEYDRIDQQQKGYFQLAGEWP